MSNLARNYCFTIQNPTPETYTTLNSFIEANCKYGIYQLEHAPSTGTPHIQGYMQLLTKKRITWLQKNCIKAAYFIARGTPEENKAYCSKEGGEANYEYGMFVTKGERTDLAIVAERLRTGATMAAVASEFPETFIRNYRGLQTFQGLVAPHVQRSDAPLVYWYYGSTGTGKSRECYQLAPTAYWKPATTKWWDGYDGVSDVIIDDYRRDFCTFAELLRLLDRYPLTVEVKGGTIEFNPKRIFITTPKSIEDTWTGRTAEDIAQLKRRVTEERRFGPIPLFPNFAESYVPHSPFNC